MCDHGNMVFAASAIARYLKNTERDVVLSVLPTTDGAPAKRRSQKPWLITTTGCALPG